MLHCNFPREEKKEKGKRRNGSLIYFLKQLLYLNMQYNYFFEYTREVESIVALMNKRKLQVPSKFYTPIFSRTMYIDHLANFVYEQFIRKEGRKTLYRI